MILFIITDNPANSRGGGFWVAKHTLEDLAGDLCVVVRYNQVTPELLAALKPWAICHSGGGAVYSEYDVLQHAPYRWLATEYDAPQIGFCGGHQILAHFFGSTLDHMGPVREDEPDLNPGYHAGLFKEWGVLPVRIVRQDPLFDGLGEVIRVQEYHMDEVKELGPDLELLASSARCRVQAFKHRAKPIYGTQFHPEQSPDTYPDGRRLLQNFFRFARAYPMAKTGGEAGKPA